MASRRIHLYCGSQFYWWGKPEDPEKTTGLSQITCQTLSHVVSSTPHLSGIRNHNFSGDRHLRFFFGGVRVAHMLCVFTFGVPCCDGSYDFCIKTMFGSSLSPVVYRCAHALFTLFVFVFVQWCPTHNILQQIRHYFFYFAITPVSKEYRNMSARKRMQLLPQECQLSVERQDHQTQICCEP